MVGKRKRGRTAYGMWNDRGCTTLPVSDGCLRVNTTGEANLHLKNLLG